MSETMPSRAYPLVSVIMIFLNAERFIEEAIGSVIAQTYAEWELLLIDDGSTDTSSLIAHRYADRSQGRIRYFAHDGHQNRGTGASRNLGLAQARGEFIAFLDADDIWLPNALATLVALADQWPTAGMIYGPTEKWYSWTGRREDASRDALDIPPQRGIRPGTLAEPPEVLRCFLLDSGAVPCICSLLVRRDLARRIGGFDDCFSGLYEDQAFYAKVALSSPIYVAGEHWARYRQHPDSMCAVSLRGGRERAARRQFLIWLSDLLRRQHVTDASLWDALERAMWPYRHPVRHLVRQEARYLRRRSVRQGRRVARRLLPVTARRWLRSVDPTHNKPIPLGTVRFGDLRRTTPISRVFGFDRGVPVDRYYIEQFLSQHANDIRGRVLEIGDDSYTRQFGGGCVATCDVLHVRDGNPKATIIGDLATADNIPSAAFDCVVLTQTLHLIYDVHSAVATIHRILKPNGVLLATVPGISQLSNDEWAESWYWAFTERSVARLMIDVFAPRCIEINSWGNVLASTAFLYGLAASELRLCELDHHDPRYQLVITARAVKSDATP